MGIRARRAAALKVLAVVVAVVAFGSVRYFTDPQRVVEKHVNAMHTLYEQFQDSEASDVARAEWNKRRDRLVRLGYLDRVDHVVPFAGIEDAQARLYAALDEQKRKNWISDWSYRPGSGRDIIITVVDESWRHAYWKDVIDKHRGLPE